MGKLSISKYRSTDISLGSMSRLKIEKFNWNRFIVKPKTRPTPIKAKIEVIKTAIKSNGL
jgi:hypothetical protein